VDGQSIHKVNFQAPKNTASTTVFSGGGLTIKAACASTNDISLTATSSKGSSTIYETVNGDGSPPAADPLEQDLENGDFDPGVNFNLLDGAAGNIDIVHFVYSATDGSVATGTIAVNESGTSNCMATGHVIVG
jgi:hypothetical protein